MKKLPGILSALILAIALSGCHKGVGGLGGGGVPIHAHDGSVRFDLSGETTISSGGNVVGFSVPAADQTVFTVYGFTPVSSSVTSLTTPWTLTLNDIHSHYVVITGDGQKGNTFATPMTISLPDVNDYFDYVSADKYKFHDHGYSGQEHLSSFRVVVNSQAYDYTCSAAGESKCYVELGS